MTMHACCRCMSVIDQSNDDLTQPETRVRSVAACVGRKALPQSLADVRQKHRWHRHCNSEKGLMPSVTAHGYNQEQIPRKTGCPWYLGRLENCLPRSSNMLKGEHSHSSSSSGRLQTLAPSRLSDQLVVLQGKLTVVRFRRRVV